MRRATAGYFLSLLTLVFLSAGCSKRYSVKVPDPPDCSGSNCDLKSSSAWKRPRCEITQPYALLNSGLTYLPFHAVSTCLGTTEDGRPQEIPLLPGMRLRISGFTMKPDGANNQVPIMSTFEWTVPRNREIAAAQTAPTPTRLDYLFLSYLMNAGFPDKASKFDIRAQLGKIGPTATCDPQCRDKIVGSALASLRVKVTPDIAAPIASRSAGSIREWLNPSQPSDSQRAHLSFRFDDLDLKLFWGWDESYFTAQAIDAKGANGTYSSTEYAGDSPIYTGHSLLTIDIPVRINDEMESRFFPIYWSIADVERRLGATVIGLRRHRNFLSPQLTERLIPAGNGSAEVVSPSDYFTVWLQKPGSFGKASYLSLGAKGYIFPYQDRSSDAIELLKEQALIAPGDVLIVAKRRTKEATDNPGYR
jgi:hypothetical protein